MSAKYIGFCCRHEICVCNQRPRKSARYDKTSSEVFASAGAKAASISFADTMPKLAEGSINAVLSSGDGGTGRKLWEFLPYFSEITYSLPLSVASVNQAIYDGLTADLREAVDTASHETEIELWLALSTRLQENDPEKVDTGFPSGQTRSVCPEIMLTQNDNVRV